MQTGRKAHEIARLAKASVAGSTMRTHLVVIVLACCIAACATARPVGESKHDAWPKTAAACAARGGEMQSVTFSSKGCVFPTTDAGRTCRDSDECEGSCDAPSGAEAGWTGMGTCSARGGPSNSGNIMIDGTASGFFLFH